MCTYPLLYGSLRDHSSGVGSLQVSALILMDSLLICALLWLFLVVICWHVTRFVGCWVFTGAISNFHVLGSLYLIFTRSLDLRSIMFS